MDFFLISQTPFQSYLSCLVCACKNGQNAIDFFKNPEDTRLHNCFKLPPCLKRYASGRTLLIEKAALSDYLWGVFKLENNKGLGGADPIAIFFISSENWVFG